MKTFHGKLGTQKACSGNVNAKHFIISDVEGFPSAFMKLRVLFQKKLTATFKNSMFSHFFSPSKINLPDPIHVHE